jgi:hypothetical protein
MLRSLIASLAGAALLSLGGTAQATVYVADLLGSNEVPPNASPATGFATVSINQAIDTMLIEVSFADLIGTTAASHIHCCTVVPDTGTAGVATVVPSFPGFPTGVTSGTYSHTFDLLDVASYNPTFVTAHGGTAAGAEAFLIAGLNSGSAYFNIHSTFAPGGEIRGFLHTVPEPATWALMILGFGLTGAALRRRRLALA